MLCEALCDAHPVIRNTGVSIQMCIICSVWHIQMLVDFLIYNVTHHIILKEETAHQVVVYIT